MAGRCAGVRGSSTTSYSRTQRSIPQTDGQAKTSAVNGCVDPPTPTTQQPQHPPPPPPPPVAPHPYARGALADPPGHSTAHNRGLPNRLGSAAPVARRDEGATPWSAMPQGQPLPGDIRWYMFGRGSSAANRCREVDCSDRARAGTAHNAQIVSDGRGYVERTGRAARTRGPSVTTPGLLHDRLEDFHSPAHRVQDHPARNPVYTRFHPRRSHRRRTGRTLGRRDERLFLPWHQATDTGHRSTWRWPEARGFPPLVFSWPEQGEPRKQRTEG